MSDAILEAAQKVNEAVTVFELLAGPSTAKEMLEAMIKDLDVEIARYEKDSKVYGRSPLADMLENDRKK